MNKAAGPIILCFGVLDEGDFIQYFIEHHLRAGVDVLVGADLGSTDGTVELCKRYEADGRVHLSRYNQTQPFDESGAPVWYGDLLAIAREVFDAAWCLFCDADELWMFPNGDAQQYFASAHSDIITFPRYNVLPQRTGNGAAADVDAFEWVVSAPIDFRYDPQDLQDMAEPEKMRQKYPPEILRSVLPKVAARANAIKAVTRGFHDVVPRESDASRTYERNGYVAHYPIRSPQQIESKAKNISKFMAEMHKDFEQRQSPHWTRWSKLLEQGMIEGEFDAQVLTPQRRGELAAQGVITRDERLSHNLRAISALAQRD